MLRLLAQISPSQLIILVGAGVAVIFLLIMFAVFTRYFRLWIQSVTTCARVV